MRAHQMAIGRYSMGVSLTIIALSACSGNSTTATPPQGGDSSIGGSASGGAASGGSSQVSVSGGAGPAGGSPATGGINATGGASATSAKTGGAPSTGGAVATGGTKTAGGGTAATGGAQPTGGKGATGGESATGGAITAGGAQPTGGKGATGGSSPTGGTKAAGGTLATGGQNTGAGGSSQSTTCPSPVLTAGDMKDQTVQVGSLSRTYVLHVPSAYKGTTPVPLIVDFHPIGGSDTGEESDSPFSKVTDPEGVVTAYPQGENSPNMGPAWDVGPCCDTSDDVAFAKALVAQVETKACIDTKRVYAVGFSMGGGMSHYLGCKAADVFAAVAPASFDLLAGSAPAGNADDCKPARPIPVLSFRGTGDTVATYGGGYSSLVTGMPITFLGAKACWQKWASIDGCTDSPAYPPTPTSSAWQCAYYKQCQANVQVGICINNGPHEYGDGTIGWTFLKQFTLP